MKKLLSLLLALCLLVMILPIVPATAETTTNNPIISSKTTMKILGVGNSFTLDSMDHLYRIAKLNGYTDITLGHIVLGGCSLKTHAQYFTDGTAGYEWGINTTGTWVYPNTSDLVTPIDTALEYTDWDAIVIQQASASSAVPAEYEPYLTTVIDYITGKCPNAKICWNMTWAYPNNTTRTDFVNFDRDQMRMYNSIVDCLSYIDAHDEISTIFPAGTAVQNLRAGFYGDTMCRDEVHLNLYYGRYTAAMTWFCGLTGFDPENMTWLMDGYITVDELNAIKEAVNNAFKTPRAVTLGKNIGTAEQNFRFAGGFNTANYSRLTLSYTAGAHWDSTQSTQQINNADSHYIATGLLSGDDLPNGSVIVAVPGYRFRPDGFADETTLNTVDDRPAVITNRFTVVEKNWNTLPLRGFNIEKTDGSVFTAEEINHIDNCFAVFVPKAAGAGIQDPSKGLNAFSLKDLQGTFDRFTLDGDNSNPSKILSLLGSTQKAPQYLAGTMLNVDLLVKGQTSSQTYIRCGANGWSGIGILFSNPSTLQFANYTNGTFTTDGTNVHPGGTGFTIDAAKAGVSGFSDNEFNLKLGFETGSWTLGEKTYDIRVGVYINNVLYNNNYFYTTDDGDTEDILTAHSAVLFYTATGTMTVSNADNRVPAGLEKIHTGLFKGVTLPDHETLDGTLVVQEVTLPNYTGAYFDFGGKASNWHGLRIQPTSGGNLAARWIRSDTEVDLVAEMTAATAGLSTFFDTPFLLKISFEIVDSDGDTQKDDLKIGIFFNDRLYANRFFYLTDQAPYLGNKYLLYTADPSRPVTLNAVLIPDEVVDLITHSNNIGHHTNAVYFQTVPADSLAFNDDWVSCRYSFSSGGVYIDNVLKTGITVAKINKNTFCVMGLGNVAEGQIIVIDGCLGGGTTTVQLNRARFQYVGNKNFLFENELYVTELTPVEYDLTDGGYTGIDGETYTESGVYSVNRDKKWEICTERETQNVTLYKAADVNEDGTANVVDLVAVKKHIAGNRSLSAPAKLAADMDGNQAVNADDLPLFKHYLLHGFSQ